MKVFKIVPFVFAGLPLLASAQQMKEGYVDWGITGIDFPKAFSQWEKGQKWTTDDNFFISRVKPKKRFRNQATQVNPALDESNDKKLIYWIPINRKAVNGLADGLFDSEVFPMWSYVTHYGDWTAPLMRVPGVFSDAAHKNGVAVSSVASVPWGRISDEWAEALDSLSITTPEKMASFLNTYGIDGIGYNSEFVGPADIVRRLAGLHQGTLKIMRGEYNNPVAELIWYDGTNIDGKLTFDQGLGVHNVHLWGWGDHERSSLFFNYNWNYDDLLEYTVGNANAVGRTPLDLYCSINMQGREPKNNNPEIWPLLAKYPVSIGLWGAHEESMFFESRAEKGASPDQRQRTYLDRMEKWFSGGNRNPALTPEFSNEISYGADNDDFFGMAKMMSARSALKWDLSEEPFITYFNLGNGKFLNYKGVRQHDREWYNIGIQDYLPTWMWWFSKKLLGNNPEDVTTDGLKADYVWDDAWFGGSTVRIHGTSPQEYLHLFKTEFGLEDGDIVTFRYKLSGGKGDAKLVLTLKGKEHEPIQFDSTVLTSLEDTPEGEWIEKKYIVGKDLRVSAGSELALVALEFENANNLDLRLGEFSIVRPKDMSAEISQPIIETSELLSAYNGGTDGKIIFHMSGENEDEPVYNADVNTSMFKLYSQQEGAEPRLMGLTTSWAGIVFDAPYDMTGSDKVRYGVSALSLDHYAESPVAWGEYHDVLPKYEVSEEIFISNPMPRQKESFTIGYADPKHKPMKWQIMDTNGKVAFKGGSDRIINVKKGLKQPGLYSIVIENSDTVLTLKDRIQVIDKNSTPSKGVYVGKDALGFKSKETGISSDSSFSISFWFNADAFDNQSVEMLNIRSRQDPWAKNQWGWFWHTLSEDGNTAAFSLRTKDGDVINYELGETTLYPGIWNHITYVFEVNENGEIRPAFYLNGKRQKITGWSIGDLRFDAEPGFIFPAEDWNEDYVVDLGGYIHRSGSVRGMVDNFMVWKKALSADGVQDAMKDSLTLPYPDSLIGYFDFEENFENDGTFTNKASGNIILGTHRYRDSAVEGQGEFYWTIPVITEGK